MQITLELPDEIAAGLGGEAELRRRVVEAVVLQRYLAGEVSLGRLAELLDFSHAEAESFLDRNHARFPFPRERLEEERRNLASIFGAW
jgi:predicted HTH domain antitoxin